MIWISGLLWAALDTLPRRPLLALRRGGPGMSHTIPLNLDLSDGVLIGIALGLFCAVVVFLFAYTGRRNK